MSVTSMEFHVTPCQENEYNTESTCTNTGIEGNETAPTYIHIGTHRRRIEPAIAAFNQMLQAPPGNGSQKSLGEFKLTAYTVDPRSTGKPRSAPDFGVTASGSHAVVGRTVAVDPQVIPIGTPIYIKGIGWRLAEDVGGAVKGRHIDVLLASEAEAIRFGVKRHIEVFVADRDVQAE